MALTLSHFRFGADDGGTEATHGWHAAEDTNPNATVIALDTTFLLRFCVQANATGLTNVDNEFQYRKNGGTWTNITTTSNDVRAVAATALTNGSDCTKRLSGTGTFEASAAGQTEDGTSGGTSNDIVSNGNSETECGLQLRSADLVAGDLIEFRLTRDGGTLLDTYSVVPALSVPVSATPAEGPLTLAGAAASLVLTLGMAAGSLAFTGHAPTLSVVENTTIEVPAGALVFKGPARPAGANITPDPAALAFTGYAPSLQDTLTPDTGPLTFAGYEPTLSQALTLEPATAALTLTGTASALQEQFPVAADAYRAGGVSPGHTHPCGWGTHAHGHREHGPALPVPGARRPHADRDVLYAPAHTGPGGWCAGLYGAGGLPPGFDSRSGWDTDVRRLRADDADLLCDLSGSSRPRAHGDGQQPPGDVQRSGRHADPHRI
jgi:hypothetical protein